ncbi:MAG TPA: efflux RND transporter periplasmic adaptor subunit [Bryobacteraceae bacterium]
MISRNCVTRRQGRAGWLGILALSGLILFTGCEKQNAAPPQPQQGAMPVSVVSVEASDVPLTNEWVGTMDGYVNAQIQPQVSGYLVEQRYREGSIVQKDQVLFQIDPRPFQAVLDQSQAQVEQAQGQLGQAEAQLALAKINVNRDTPLAAQRAIAQSQLDNERQQQLQQEASVKAAQASIAAAKAAVETAQLNLGFTEVRSLITGVAGQATTQVGNLVSPQSVLTAVSQMNPIKVYFSISDAEYLGLTKRLKGGGTDLLKSASDVPLTLHLSDGSVYPRKGQVVYVDRQMNQQTGAIRIAAAFANPGNVLRPGQFGRVSANTEIRQHAILIPQSAVADLQGQKQVFAVGGDNKVHVTNVTVGSEVGQNVVILSGLQPGTTIVTDNLQKLREGAPVAPHKASAAPAAGGGDTGGK